MRALVIALALANLCARAAEGDELIMQRSYIKSGRYELRLDAGTIMNQAFVETHLARATVGRYLSERFGLALSYAFALNQDKATRDCVESFYNDPAKELDVQCASEDSGDELDRAQRANIGPAYAPIRELTSIMTLDGVWSPIYGKQIILHSAVVHFDLQIIAGVGLSQARYYPQQTHLRDNPDRPSRGDFPADGQNGMTPGTTATETDAIGTLYGKDGRPEAQTQTLPILSAAMVERFLFLRRFDVSLELRDYALLGSPLGWENFLALYVGFGVRL